MHDICCHQNATISRKDTHTLRMLFTGFSCHEYICMCVYIYMCVCIYVYMYVCMYCLLKILSVLFLKFLAFLCLFIFNGLMIALQY